MYKILAKINKILLPSFTKQGLDISKAKNGKWQLLVTGLLLQKELYNNITCFKIVGI